MQAEWNEQQILEAVRSAQTIAVYGMQDEAKSDRAAFAIPQALKARGYTIYPINPTIRSSLGLPALAHLNELPVQPDILDVFRRSELIAALAAEVLALPEDNRPRLVWLQSGVTDPVAEQQLRAAGVPVVSDRCLGAYAARAGRPLRS
jgi:predicted CoA-binding protein